MAFDSETETQVSTVFPNKIRKYLDRVCSDVEMTRSQFVRKSVKENLKEYATQNGEIDFLNEIYDESKVQLNV
jgi:metal-responsive CopG/Arc/MetJ family transcriptional regulator